MLGCTQCLKSCTSNSSTQGARRIVAEWPDLDLEARHFTSKILGEAVSPVEKVVSPPAQPHVPEEAGPPPTEEEDEESRAEL